MRLFGKIIKIKILVNGLPASSLEISNILLFVLLNFFDLSGVKVKIWLQKEERKVLKRAQLKA